MVIATLPGLNRDLLVRWEGVFKVLPALGLIARSSAYFICGLRLFCRLASMSLAVMQWQHPKDSPLGEA